MKSSVSRRVAAWRRSSVVAIAAAAALPGTALAQSSDALPETVVTATRTEAAASQLTSEVVVIDREQIERAAGSSVAEVLRQYAGVQIWSNGGLGKSGSVSIRGTETRHTLLLVDGVRYGSATAGGPVWDNIPLDAIERIEVVKGPASALYGSDAVGGVVQIFTRRGEEGVHPRASTTLGSRGYRSAAAGLSGGSGNLSYSMDVQALRDGGFSATNAKNTYSYNPDRDGFTQRSFDGSLDWRFAPGWKLSLGLLYATGTNHFDDGEPYDGSSVDTRADVRTQVARTGLEGQVTDIWKTRIDFGQSVDRSDQLTSAFPEYDLPAFFRTTQNQWTWQNDVRTPLGTFTAGAERVEQRVKSSTDYDVAHRDVDSLFAGLTGEYGPHGWQFNLRRDDNSQFGDKTTGYAGYGLRLAPEWRAHVGYGTSFVAPTFNQLYYPGYSNPDLRPERGRNWETGLDWTHGAHHAKVVYYDNRISDFIGYDANYLPANVARARIRGWTLGYDADLGTLGLHAGLDLMNPRNETDDTQLARRARRQLTLGADYALGAWTFGGSVAAVGERYSDTGNTQRLPGYALVGLSASYAVNRDWSVQLRLDNLLDKDYETAYGYNQPGRGAFVTLRWQPRR